MSYIYNLADTWNAGGTTFTGIGLNVTDTASAAGSMLIDLQVGGASQFKVTKAGAATITTIELGNASDTTLSRVSAGVVAIEGVEVTTNTATQTLTNKTLSSPTLSGTVAGPATFSGKVTAGATSGVTFEVNGATDAKTRIDHSGGTAKVAWVTTNAAANAYAANEWDALSYTWKLSSSSALVLSSGVFTYGGVAIPTISSTDTLTNKTLSSPTLSGTVAGTPSFSSAPVFSAGFEWGSNLYGPSTGFAATIGANPSGSVTSGGFIQLYGSAHVSGPLAVVGAGGGATFIVGASSIAYGGVAIPTISSTDTLSNKTVRTVASTTGGAGLRIPSGVAPTTPVSGDIWYDGTNLKFQDGATTRTLTWT